MSLPLLAARELGLLRQPGSSYYFQWLTRPALEDRPVVAAVHANCRRKVADLAGIAPDLVCSTLFTPEYLADFIDRHQSPFAPLELPAADVGAIVAFCGPRNVLASAARPRLTLVKETP